MERAMAFTIGKDQIIDYSSERLADFYVYGFEWIDNLHFIRAPEEILSPKSEGVVDYITSARRRFLADGWKGDGEIGLLWLPPFVFPRSMKVPTVGVLLWHVKQEDDGISWLLSPIELPFDE